MRAHQMSDASTKRQPGHPRVAERATRCCEAVPLARRVEVLPQRAASAVGGSSFRIHDDVAHQPQVDDKAPVTDAMAGDTVPATADGDRQIGRGSERDGRNHVVHVERARDQCGPSVEHPVERRAGGIERHPVIRADYLTTVLPAEIGERRPLDNCHAPS
jgi:hypothetical protein